MKKVMNNISQEKQDKIIKVIEIFFPHAKIYLFGSRAKDTYKINSDIDIAIDAGKALTMTEIGQLNSMLDALNIPQNIDLVDFQRALQVNIMHDGIVWKN